MTIGCETGKLSQYQSLDRYIDEAQNLYHCIHARSLQVREDECDDKMNQMENEKSIAHDRGLRTSGCVRQFSYDSDNFLDLLLY
ncbi:unnamed protein product [Amoebophrya sp. A120]|nr:unnamed protein product [Amoebophrya sp. A120]|eukprot:GSA120T00019712001.1